MREIKFKALTKNPADDSWQWEYFDVKDLFSRTDWYFNPENIKLETVGQYTGLKDKNGTEIYEEDVINYRLPGGWVKCKVTYKEPCFRLYCNPKDEETLGQILWEDERKNWFYEDLGKDNEYVEVIGNIYENPELLK